MIIERYLIREIIRPFAAVFGVLVVLFASYSTASLLADAVNGLLPIRVIAALVGLKVVIALEVLIPISLYLSVVLSFSRLHGESEFTAMSALGVTPARVAGAVFTVSVYVAAAVLALSLLLRPLAYKSLHTLSRQAQILVNVNAMQAGTFYVGAHGDRVIFVTRRDGPDGPARDVFVRIKNSSFTEIIYARLAVPLARTTNVYLSNAHIYQISHDKNQPDQILSAQSIVVNPEPPAAAPPEYSAVETSSAQLARSKAASDVAEFQWRLSTPLSAILLGLLGIPLSRAAPRQGRYARFGTAIVIYAGYYLLITSARTWVQHGVVPAFPGIWWAPALLAAVLLTAAFGTRLRA